MTNLTTAGARYRMWNKDQKPPQRGESTRAAASDISGKHRKRGSILLLLVLAAIGMAFGCNSAFRSWLSGILMLFTQKSVHTLAGSLRSFGPWAAIYALVLSIFQAVFLPWLPRILPLAICMVFGSVYGFFLSFMGVISGGSVCFFLSRLLLRTHVERLEPQAIRRLSVNLGGTACFAALLCFPGATGIVGYLAGMSNLNYSRYLLGVAAGEGIGLAAYWLYCTPYSTLLPVRVRAYLVLIGILVFVIRYVITHRISKEKR